MSLTQTFGKIVVAFRAKVAIMAGIIWFARAGAIDRFTVISVRSYVVTLAGYAVWIAIVSVVATVAIRRPVFLATLAFVRSVRAIPGRIEDVAIASCRVTYIFEIRTSTRDFDINVNHVNFTKRVLLTLADVGSVERLVPRSIES